MKPYITFIVVILACSCLKSAVVFGGSFSQSFEGKCISNPCLNGGACASLKPYRNVIKSWCMCRMGYSGKYCENGNGTEPCTKNLCQNGGKCVVYDYLNTFDKEEVDKGCACPKNFTGDLCQLGINDPVNPCRGITCENGGQCSWPGVCNCPIGFGNTLCQNATDKPAVPCKDDSLCFNGGACFSYKSEEYCRCPEDTTGDRCETDLTLNNTCLNGGACEDVIPGISVVCHCPAGITGVRCEKRSVAVNPCKSNSCLNGGSCNSTGDNWNCSCPTGYSGLQCERKDCTLDEDVCALQRQCGSFDNSIYNRTTFSSLRVVCDEASRFLICVKNTTNYINGSSNWASVQDRYIQCCLRGGVLPQCPVQGSSCAERACHNGATCSDVQGGFRCTCPGGFTGPRCEINTDDCGSMRCSRNATCVDSVQGYYCLCPVGYHGRNCELGSDKCPKVGLFADEYYCTHHYTCWSTGGTKQRTQCGKLAGIYQMLFDANTRVCLLPSTFTKVGAKSRVTSGCIPDPTKPNGGI